MNILITGGLGYVGGRLSQYFAKQENYKVYALTRGKKVQNKLKNLEVLKNEDVLEKNVLENVHIDVLIHLASMNEHESVNFPREAIDVNIKGTLNWLIWARENKVGQFIFFSTAHIYGKPLEGLLEENSQAVPQHPYSITHKAAEDYVLNFHDDYDLNTKVVRLSNSFGYPAFTTANRWTLLINDICKNIVQTREFRINSNRIQERDFISLQNVCEAIEKLIKYSIPAKDNRIFNLCSSNSKTLFEVGTWIKKIAEEKFQEKIDFFYDTSKDSEVVPLYLSNEKLKDIGWNPDPAKDAFEIEKTFDFFLENKEMF